MEWQVFTLWWYVILSIIGIVFLPTTRLLFARFYDQGYAFSKIIGILAITYTTFVLGTLKIAPFTPATLIGIVIAAGIVNAFIYKKNQRSVYLF
ncbi:MAG: hypothetical protein UZ22_OP11002000788 [Microgenomates bacterium OLB23]|nr:MAG: hypothetical protein UZ22_OP11002000788 [Microgenomates bacterium OLB23]